MAAINKRKLLESAQKNLQKGALDKALKDYQELLAADPRDANVRLKVGDLQLKRGQTDDAIAAYLKVADQFMRDGFDAKAVAIYKQVTKIDGKRFDVYIPLADLYQRIGLTSDAMAALQTAAEAYQRDGRRHEALDLLRRMAGLDPTNTASRLKVAELLHQEGLADEAFVEFEEAAAELGRQGDWEGRANILDRIADLYPNRLEALEALVTLWCERSSSRRAEPYARRLVALDPDRAESCELLAGIVADLGDEAAAIELYRRAADAWIARGQDDHARAILQRHVPSEPFDLGGSDLPETPQATSEVASESPFGEEGIGGEPPPVADEFSFDPDAVASGASAPTEAASSDPEFELELDDASEVAEASAPSVERSAPAPVRAAPAIAAAPAAEERATGDEPLTEDSEQLLAEAAVYLRYGKHERAIASLETVLAREPEHLGALEQLGEAHQRAEALDRAIETWSRALEIAVRAGETAQARSLRDRIEAVGGTPAASVAPPARANAAATVLFEAQAPATASDEATPSGDVELEEFEIDLDAADLGDETPREEPPAMSEAEVQPDASVARTDHDSAVDADADAASFIDASAPESFASEPALEPMPTNAPDETPALELPGDFERGQETASLVEAAEPVVHDEEPVGIEIDLGPEFELSVGAHAVDSGAEHAPTEEPIESDDSADAADLSGDSNESLAPHPSEESLAAAIADAPAEEVLPGVSGDAPLEQAMDSDANTAEMSGARSVHDETPSAPPAELSATSGQQIAEDLEEASFYFEQGLLDEAEAIYRRIVERAPSHPAALLRLGEIAVARGQDPGEVAAETEGSVPTAPAPEADDAEPVIEPPDDLDLTAREFGPGNGWDEVADESAADAGALGEPTGEEAASSGIQAESALDRTDPEDWTAPTSEPLQEPGESSDADVAPTADVAEVQGAGDAEAPAEISDESVAPAAPAESAAIAHPELTSPEFVSEEAGAAAFDLAAELSEALDDEAAPTPACDDDGFSALFSEFKRGVSRTLGEADVETHFDLGIAYREMGLYEDAIGEFRYALGSSERRLDALHMMGVCAIDLLRPADAVGHLEQALASPDVPAGREVALRYDLGRAYESLGDRERAFDALSRVVDLEPGFQDVAQRIEALRAQEPTVPDPAVDAPEEIYESFDDLIAQDVDPAQVERVPEAYESFDEFRADEADEAGPASGAMAPAASQGDEMAAESTPPADEEAPAAPAASKRRKISFF